MTGGLRSGGPELEGLKGPGPTALALPAIVVCAVGIAVFLLFRRMWMRRRRRVPIRRGVIS